MHLVSAIFLARYSEFLEQHESKGKSGPKTYATRSTGYVVGQYLASEDFKRIAETTQQMRLRHLRVFRKQYGNVVFADIEDRHIKRDLAKLAAHGQQPPEDMACVIQVGGRTWRSNPKFCFDGQTAHHSKSHRRNPLGKD